MSSDEHDTGLIVVLMERFEKQHLPRAQSLKEKVDRGELLDEFDVAFLEEVLTDAHEIKPILDRHPEYQDIAARAIHLYKQITDRAMQNEKERRVGKPRG
jgi:hypothetical protein